MTTLARHAARDMSLSSAWGSMTDAGRQGRMFAVMVGYFADAVIELINWSSKAGMKEEDGQTDLGHDTTIRE
jgi:hypothetical protein